MEQPPEKSCTALTSLSIADRAGSPDHAIISRHLFGRLAIALWSGNASLWLHRHPTLPVSGRGSLAESLISCTFPFALVKKKSI